MSQFLANVLNTAIIVLESVILYVLADGLFEQRRNWYKKVAAFTVVTVIHCLILFFVGTIQYVKYFSALLMAFVLIVYCYKVSIVKSLFPVVFWLAYITIGDNAIISAVAAAMGSKAQYLFSDPYAYCLMSFSAKIAELFGIVVIHNWTKHHYLRNTVNILDWLRVLYLPLATLLLSVFLLKIFYDYPSVAHELLVCNAILLVLDIISVFVLNYIERQQETVRDAVILRQSMKTELESVEAWKKAYEQQRKQTHDFNNLIIALHGFVESNAPQSEMLHYIERLQNVSTLGTTTVKTHRTAADVILSQKSAIAESRGIRFTMQLDDLSKFPLADDELIIVLSNLIDNAIEACEKVSDESKRYVLLKMRVEEQASFLYIENLTTQPVVIKDNKIITTKKNKMEHGYGLQNVVSVLDKHDAFYVLKYYDDTHLFSFSTQVDKKQ